MPEMPQAEVDETQKIVVDWFGEDKLPDALAKRLAEFLSAQKHEHSPFETTPIKPDTGSEIVRDWYEDEPEQMVDGDLQTWDNEADAYRYFLWNAQMTRCRNRYDNSKKV